MTPALDRYAKAEPDYPGVGATLRGTAPPGYRALRRRFPVGQGDDALAKAADAILSWQLQRAMGLRVTATAPRAAPGVTVVGVLGPAALGIVTPCRVVWAAEPGTGGRAGFGCGTLPGHIARGEEAFTVDQDAGGQVWLAVESFSQPARWFTRAAGPAFPAAQAFFVRRCAVVLRRLLSG